LERCDVFEALEAIVCMRNLVLGDNKSALEQKLDIKKIVINTTPQENYKLHVLHSKESLHQSYTRRMEEFRYKAD